MAGYPERTRHEIERAVGDDGLLLFHLADDGRIVGVSRLGRPSFAKEFKIAQVMAERGLAPEPALLRDPGTRLKALLR
jgi:3-phenylpropionate/trans-cinnamate dioxygenase ferredoxin reductase component